MSPPAGPGRRRPGRPKAPPRLRRRCRNSVFEAVGLPGFGPISLRTRNHGEAVERFRRLLFKLYGPGGQRDGAPQ